MLKFKNFENYERIFNNNLRTYKLVNPEKGKEIEVVTCCVVKSRDQLSKLYNYLAVNNFNVDNFNLDELERVRHPEIKIYLKLRLLNRCDGVHLAFRPIFEDIIKLQSICPKLKVIFISKSYADQIGYNCFLYIENSKNLKIEQICMHGYRSDKSADYQIEIYKKVGERPV